MKRIVFLSLSAVLALTVSACGQKKAEVLVITEQPVSSASPGGTVIATFDGQPITDEDVRKVAGAKLSQAEMGLYEARKDGIDEIVQDRLLDAEAKREGISKADLLKKKVYDKVKVSDRDVEKFYKEKKDQMQGKKLDDVKANIRSYLFREENQKLYADYVASLKKKANVQIMIQPPKIDIGEGDSPAIGPKDAPVVIIEFTDYQCPFCGRSRPTVQQILDNYKGKVRYVLRDFPLSFHKDSEKAHEAAHCAGDQGKYWEMNKKLFANQKDIKMEDLKKYAQELKLNMNKFNECLDSGKYADMVRKNLEDGEKAGVTGTPAFFINGRMISGARPYESFKEVIDDELERAK
jgi:protein-disulfide isomerase